MGSSIAIARVSCTPNNYGDIGGSVELYVNRSRWQRKRRRVSKLATRAVDGSSVLYTSAPTMAAYFRRRAAPCTASDDPYPALLVTGSTAAPCDPGDRDPSAAVLGGDVEKV